MLLVSTSNLLHAGHLTAALLTGHIFVGWHMMVAVIYTYSAQHEEIISFHPSLDI